MGNYWSGQRSNLFDSGSLLKPDPETFGGHLVKVDLWKIEGQVQ